MTIETIVHEGGSVVTPVGRMDAESAPQFEAACTALMAHGTRRLVADLGRLEYVSSLGLRSFLVVAKACQAAGGELALANMSGMVKQVFDLTRLTPLFAVHSSVDKALGREP